MTSIFKTSGGCKFNSSVVMCSASFVCNLWVTCILRANRWYDFNDSRVTPLSIFGIEKQFEGKENAYMLFYRRIAATGTDTVAMTDYAENINVETPIGSGASSKRSDQANVSARDVLTGKVQAPTLKPSPPRLVEMPSFWKRYIEQQNTSLAMRRDLYDRLANQISVHVYLPECFEVCTDGVRFVEPKTISTATDAETKTKVESKSEQSYKKNVSVSVDARIAWPALRALLRDRLGKAAVQEGGECRFIHHVNPRRPEDGFYLGARYAGGPEANPHHASTEASGGGGVGTKNDNALVEGTMLLLLPPLHQISGGLQVRSATAKNPLRLMRRAATAFVERGAKQRQILENILASKARFLLRSMPYYICVFGMPRLSKG